MMRRNALKLHPRLPGRERGSTLVISLIMLVLITLFAVTAVNMSNSNMRVVGNYQIQKQMEAAAQQAIDQVMSRSTSFGSTAAAQTIAVNGYNVTVTAAVCIATTPATGFSAAMSTSAITPEDNDFEVIATVTDPLTGARAVIHQGVRMRMLAGSCA